MRTRSLALAAVAAAAACAPAADGGPSAASPSPTPSAGAEGDARGAEHARAQLVADVGSVVPGVSFDVAVRLEMDDRWHVYWENPGASGLATEASLRAPGGFRAGPLRFPGPERLVGPGDIVTYGYEHEVLLPFRVTAPAEPGPGPFRFEADVTWLVCEDGGSCIPGAATVALELPLDGDADPAPGTHAGAFADLRARLPRRWSELDPAPAVAWDGPADAPRLTFTLEGADLEVFPAASDVLFLDRRQRQPGRLVVTYDHQPPENSTSPPRAQGLLRMSRGGEPGFYEFDMKRPGP